MHCHALVSVLTLRRLRRDVSAEAPQARLLRTDDSGETTQEDYSGEVAQERVLRRSYSSETTQDRQTETVYSIELITQEQIRLTQPVLSSSTSWKHQLLWIYIYGGTVVLELGYKTFTAQEPCSCSPTARQHVNTVAICLKEWTTSLSNPIPPHPQKVILDKTSGC